MRTLLVEAAGMLGGIATARFVVRVDCQLPVQGDFSYSGIAGKCSVQLVKVLLQNYRIECTTRLFQPRFLKKYVRASSG